MQQLINYVTNFINSHYIYIDKIDRRAYTFFWFFFKIFSKNADKGLYKIKNGIIFNTKFNTTFLIINFINQSESEVINDKRACRNVKSANAH